VRNTDKPTQNVPPGAIIKDGGIERKENDKAIKERKTQPHQLLHPQYVGAGGEGMETASKKEPRKGGELESQKKNNTAPPSQPRSAQKASLNPNAERKAHALTLFSTKATPKVPQPLWKWPAFDCKKLK